MQSSSYHGSLAFTSNTVWRCQIHSVMKEAICLQITKSSVYKDVITSFSRVYVYRSNVCFKNNAVISARNCVMFIKNLLVRVLLVYCSHKIYIVIILRTIIPMRFNKQLFKIKLFKNSSVYRSRTVTYCLSVIYVE